MTLHLSNRRSQLLSVTEVAPKSPFLCMNRSTIRYGSRSGPKAIQHSVNIARPISFLPLLLASTSSLLKPLIGYFKIRRRDGNENVKKQQVNFISKTTTFHVHHTFLYISLPFLHDYDVKCLIFAFYSLRGKRFRASLSRKLGREQKKEFFCSRSYFRAITRLETLATQATRFMENVNKQRGNFIFLSVLSLISLGIQLRECSSTFEK